MADAMDSRLQEIERSAGTLETQLRGQIARVNSAKRTTLIVGVIVIVIIFGYMFWLSSMLRPYANSTELAGIVSTAANDYAQEQVPQIAAQLKEAAPAAVKSLCDRAVESVPQIREYAEEQTVALMESFTASLDEKVDAIVTEMIKQHKGELEPLIEAAAAKGNEEELEKAFKDSLEELIGPEMDRVFAEFNQDMDVAQRMLAYYAQPDDKLTSAELANKYLITAVLGFINEAANITPQPPQPPAAM